MLFDSINCFSFNFVLCIHAPSFRKRNTDTSWVITESNQMTWAVVIVLEWKYFLQCDEMIMWLCFMSWITKYSLFAFLFFVLVYLWLKHVCAPVSPTLNRYTIWCYIALKRPKSLSFLSCQQITLTPTYLKKESKKWSDIATTSFLVRIRSE